MRAEIEDFETGWYQVNLSIKKEEIDGLINMLKKLKNDDSQHFHLMSNYTDEVGVADIEVDIQQENEKDNMIISGVAIEPTR